jgi:hypothetical protein
MAFDIRELDNVTYTKNSTTIVRVIGTLGSTEIIKCDTHIDSKQEVVAYTLGVSDMDPCNIETIQIFGIIAVAE